MKIAIPSKNNMVDNHFGHCEYFTVFTVDSEKNIVAEEKVESPAECGCRSQIVGTLSQMGVEVMLAGSMGDGAVNVLGRHGIDVLRGCSGSVRDVAEGWLKGNVKDSGTSCTQHEHGCSH